MKDLGGQQAIQHKPKSNRTRQEPTEWKRARHKDTETKVWHTLKKGDMTFKRILSFTHQQISVEVHFVAKSYSVHCAPTWVLFLIYAPQVQSANIPYELLRAATGAADLTRTRTNCKSNWAFSRLCVAKEFVSGNRHICSNMELPVMPHEAVPEISNGKVYI